MGNYIGDAPQMAERVSVKWALVTNAEGHQALTDFDLEAATEAPIRGDLWVFDHRAGQYRVFPARELARARIFQRWLCRGLERLPVAPVETVAQHVARVRDELAAVDAAVAGGRVLADGESRAVAGMRRFVAENQ
ncbi:hypothetical protein [Paraburkholderia sp. J8-2]|uniref:hypothetical protein n=1 Tax=Paraburkholderia sp. J8-2 TaxID=2805440 RepID=UPI002AB78195|nr:hypothetical protein [Paraburkholderia sp. J8-2]